jgi:NAD(P)-dependent dehydrogenase (short-subunit alcohol dehydrogenase family)
VRGLEGQFAVVTGGGTGVGAVIALALAAAKASTCLVGPRLTRLQAVATSARARGVEAACYPADLASESRQFDLVQRLMRDLPYLDILAQNAAMHVSGPIDCAGLEDFDEHYRTNVRAPYALTQALLRMLKVVFINSSSGISANPTTAVRRDQARAQGDRRQLAGRGEQIRGPGAECICRRNRQEYSIANPQKRMQALSA